MNNGLSINDIEDRFFVCGRMEILDVLNDLIHRCEPVTVNFNAGKDLLRTTLLEVRGQMLIFEMGKDNDVNRRLPLAATCSFVAFPDGIRVQFDGSSVQRIAWGDSNAFAIALPAKLARVQRQEALRIQVPLHLGLKVRLYSDAGAGLGEWPLHNLSVGGIGIAIDQHAHIQVAQRVGRIKLLLPEHGTIECAVTLRHATSLPNGKDDAYCRIGLKFAGLPLEMRAAIQRYIISIEHERRSLDEQYEADDSFG